MTTTQISHLGITERWMPDPEEAAVKKAYDDRDSSNDPMIVDQLQERQAVNRILSERNKIEGQADAERHRPGQILSMGEVLYRLRRIDPSFFYNDWSAKGLVGLNCLRQGQPVYCKTAVQLGMCREWDEVRLDEHGLAAGFKHRGWRSNLLALIENGFISEQAAHREFGEPSGPYCENYKRQLFNHRSLRKQ